MITIAKLRTLKDRTCVRKCAHLFHQMSQNPDPVYLKGLCSLFSEKQFCSVLNTTELAHLAQQSDELFTKEGRALQFACEDIHYFLLGVLGSEPADWDFTDESGELDCSKRLILEQYLILDRVRSPFNVGAIFRSAESFGIRKIFLIEGCADINHPRAQRSSRGCTKTVDSERIGEEDLLRMLDASELEVFALETGGQSIDSFSFPKRGFAVIGSEELGVSPALLARCEASLGRLSIPLAGSKGSLNVSVASGIMLYSWFASSVAI
ncbi:MAG: TrmH family RNA methyltransferase [Spirochaetia bacterium]|nr:TrmH family RNA methyltransferase [Spirochaetia bacterium]